MRLFKCLTIVLVGGLTASSLASLPIAWAASSVVIIELQTGSASSASAEFVRIANNSENSVDLTGWALKTTPATGDPTKSTDQTKRASLSGTLPPHASLLIASSSVVTTEQHLTMTSAGMATDGHVEVVDSAGAVADLVGWGNAAHAEGGHTAPRPAADQSLMRLSASGGVYTDTDDNQADFTLYADNGQTTPVGSGDPAQPPTLNDGLAPAIVNELLPNPAAPLSDDKDEFVELYNPNPSTFYLASYKLQVGSKFSYSLTFKDESIPPLGYLVIKSGASSLTLSNTSGAARLLDPSGNEISLSDSYSVAAEGQAWALFDGTWKWTSSPTPGSANKLSNVLGAATTSSSASSSKTAAAKPKSSTAKTTKAAKSTKSTTKSTAASQDQSKDLQEPAQAKLHPLILAGIGLLAVAYGVYEYRQDIANLIYKFRRNRSARRENRSEA